MKVCIRMPKTAPISVTASSSAAHCIVAWTSPGTMPWSTARPKMKGPNMGGSCQNMPSAVVVRITGHWSMSIHHEEPHPGARVRRGSGLAPAARVEGVDHRWEVAHRLFRVGGHTDGERIN